MVGHARHVLVIEDDAATAEQLVDCLKSTSYAVDLAVDGEDGLRRALAADYVVMTVDRMVPGIDGIEIIRRLREQGILTPACVMTSTPFCPRPRPPLFSNHGINIQDSQHEPSLQYRRQHEQLCVEPDLPPWWATAVRDPRNPNANLALGTSVVSQYPRRAQSVRCRPDPKQSPAEI